MLLKSAVRFKPSSGLYFLPKLWGDRGVWARENRGREGYGRREKKGWEARSLRWREAGEKFKKASFCYLLLLRSSQRNEPNNVSWLPFNVFRGLKQNLYARKVKKRKFILGIKKKQHYFLWNWKPFQVAYNDHRTWMRWHDTCTRVSSSSTVSVVSVVSVFCLSH